MSVELLSTYLAMDRRCALAAGEVVQDRTTASVLFADIAGFTPLTEALVESLGPRQGAEELTRLLNLVYTSLVAQVHRFGGSVIHFIGDALLCCFSNDTGLRAVACALEMQRSMKEFQAVPTPKGGEVAMAMKAAVAFGTVRRFLAGDPTVQLLDVVAGTTVDRVADAEHVSGRGEVIVTPEVARHLAGQLVINEWRGPFGVVVGLRDRVLPQPWPAQLAVGLEAQHLRPFLLPAVYDRIVKGSGEFLAELRPVVVLFLRFMGVDYDLDDLASEKIGAFSAWVQARVSQYGGDVLLLTTADKGSHLYAVFGALATHENDGERAVAAAMALSQPPSEFGYITGIQIGVSQGRARVGAYGGETRRTYGALGDAVNLAARLMQAAPAGEIRCSQAVYEAARRHWAFDTLPAITVKGMRRPQAVYRPNGPARMSRAHDMRALIGRSAERRIIEKWLSGARSGARRVLLLEGEGGMGKSRLVEEICRLAEVEGITCAVGAADSIESHTPYRAWRDIMETCLGLADDMDPVDRPLHVVDRVSTLDLAYADRAALLNDILGLNLPESKLTTSYDPRLRHESLATLVAELLDRQLDTGPAILIIEDAHWLDSLSWELIVSVARTLAERPILFVVTHRPFAEPIPARYGTLSRMSDTQKVMLESIPAEDVLALAASRLGVAPSALPKGVADLLVERAAGNPFFAVELAGALYDGGLLAVKGGTCTVVGDAQKLGESVPDSLERVVLSRLDRLPVEEQLTMKVASVIGRSFLVRTLGAVYPKPIEDSDLREHLDDTSMRQLTELEAVDPEPSFAFRHVVTQQVAYETLLFTQRRGLHRGVAAWYETVYEGNLSLHHPLLAFHWNRAGNAESECHYTLLAGAQAAKQYANAEAKVYFTRALELFDELDRDRTSDRRFDTLGRRARVNALLGSVDEERTDLESMLAVAELSRDVSQQGEAQLLWSDFHKRGGHFVEAFDQAEGALAMFRQSGNVGGEAKALTHIGSALEGQGRLKDARERVEDALKRFRMLNDLEGEAASQKTLGTISARLGEFDLAMRILSEASGLYRRLEDRKGEADILGNLGAVYYYLGKYDEAVARTEQAQRLFQEVGNRVGSAKCLTNLGNAYNALGVFDRGLTHHERALQLYKQLDDVNGCADSYSNLGNSQHALGVGGHPELVFHADGDMKLLRDAIASHDRALELRKGIGSRGGEAVSHFNLGSCELCIGDLEAAESHLGKALDLGRELGLSRLALRSLSALARTSLLAGDPPAAMNRSNEAIEQLGGQTLPEADELHFTQFRVLAANGRASEARQHLELAHQAVVRRAAAVGDNDLRETFLSAYHEILNAWKADEQTAPGS